MATIPSKRSPSWPESPNKRRAPCTPIPIVKLLQLQRDAGVIGPDDLMSLIAYLTAETIDPVIIFLPSRSGRYSAAHDPLPACAVDHRSQSKCDNLPAAAVFVRRPPINVVEKGLLNEPRLRRRYTADWLSRQGIDEGLVLLIEGAGTLKAEDTKRLDIIAL